MSRLIRRKPLNEYRIQRIAESFSSGGKLNVKYQLPTAHLTAVNYDILVEWGKRWDNFEKNSQNPLYTADFNNHVLDMLYNLTNKKDE